MKLKIGKETVTEPSNYRFELRGDQLYLVNVFSQAEGVFVHDQAFKTIPFKEKGNVIMQLKDNYRKVV